MLNSAPALSCGKPAEQPKDWLGSKLQLSKIPSDVRPKTVQLFDPSLPMYLRIKIARIRVPAGAVNRQRASAPDGVSLGAPKASATDIPSRSPEPPHACLVVRVPPGAVAEAHD